MASRGKKKTTMAKLTRESRLRERRFEKQARKDARKLAASDPDARPDDAVAEFDDTVAEFEDVPAAEQPAESV
jgi:hypothetical protein